VHTSAKARLSSVAIRIRIRIRDPDCHQNLIICSLAHCQPSLKSSPKSVQKLFLRKVANRQTNRQTNDDDYISSLAEVKMKSWARHCAACMYLVVMIVAGCRCSLMAAVVPDKLDQRHNGSDRQSGHQYHERAADVGDTERMGLLVAGLLVPAARARVLPPLVVEHLKLAAFLQAQYRHRYRVSVRRVCTSNKIK